VDADGNQLFGFPFEFETLDSSVATLTWNESRLNAETTFWRPGTVRLVARTVAYGTVIADTTEITVTMPVVGNVVVQPVAGAPTFDPNEVHIRTNGVVAWFNKVDRPLDVTFDDPTNVIAAPADVCSALDGRFAEYAPHCAAGNITLPRLATGIVSNPFFPQFKTIVDSTVTVRQFTSPGVYTFHEPVTGVTGRVIVSDNGTSP
jgi:hypothetical protein